jgi:uncharacterized protein YaaR (DUF327 family)
MLKLSKMEISHILKALVEHQSKLERLKSYPLQKSDIKPYKNLIKKFVSYRTSISNKRHRKAKR